MDQEYNQRTWFRVAYPRAGELSKRRWRIKPPYPGAPRWKCNVFYYWWEFLRRNAEYRAYVSGQQGLPNPDFDRVRGDWGNIYGPDFEFWWGNHGAKLFGEPMPPRVHIFEDGVKPDHPGPYVTVRIPLQLPYAKSDRQLRKLIIPIIEAHQKKTPKSLAPYRVLGKPVLTALHAYLSVFDLREQYPDQPLAEIADMAGLEFKATKPEEKDGLNPEDRALLQQDWDVELRRRKGQEAYRHLRIAKALIRNATDREWPRYT